MEQNRHFAMGGKASPHPAKTPFSSSQWQNMERPIKKRCHFDRSAAKRRNPLLDPNRPGMTPHLTNTHHRKPASRTTRQTRSPALKYLLRRLYKLLTGVGVHLPHKMQYSNPMRIASLQPSITITLAALTQLAALCASTQYYLPPPPHLSLPNP